MTVQHDVSKLDDLIVTTIDSIRGYEHSADKQAAGRFAEFFATMASERRAILAALQERSRELGGTAAEYGSTAATIHRRFEDLRTALGGGDEAIFSEIERGEDYLKEEYERVLDDDRMSPESLAVVRQAYESIRRGHDVARALREQLAAAH